MAVRRRSALAQPGPQNCKRCARFKLSTICPDRTRVTDMGYTYTYDGQNRRFESNLPGGVRHYFYQGSSASVIAEYPVNLGLPWTDYVYLSGERVAKNVNGTVSYYFGDHLGSTALMTDASGNVLSNFPHKYTAFGMDDPHYVAPSETRRYTGKERDAESELDYFEARYNSSGLGRFTSPDPLGWLSWQHGRSRDRFNALLYNPQHLDMYAYTGDDPVTWTDPTGLYTCNGTKQQCATVKAAVATIKEASGSAALTLSQKKALAAVSQFLGTEGDKNGVVISLGGTHGNEGETRTGNGVTTLAVTFTGMNGKNFVDSAERAGLIAHEATHGIDERAGGYSVPSSRIEELATETHAFNSQSLVLRALNVNDEDYGLWAPGWTDGQRKSAVDSSAQSDTSRWCAEWAAVGGGC
jgi:RHS repeat-associated protein